MNISLVFYLIAFLIIAALVVLLKLRHSDKLNAKSVWWRLSKQSKQHAPIFEASMLDGVPELVKKFFLYMIKPGTPLQYVAELKMRGQFIMGNANKSRHINVQCKQILAPLHGFVWRVKSVGGWIKFSGSDGLDDKRCWSRMWIMGLWPLSQKNRHDNITKSSFGRLTAESTVWALGALLPQKKVHWEALDELTIRVTVSTKLMDQSVDITVDPSTGKPGEIVFPRWSNANPEKKFQFQPFGAKVSGFKEVHGFMVPMQIEAGNHYGTKDYFPFYQMNIEDFEFV